MNQYHPKYPPEETLSRLKKWCDLQERAHKEVRTKLISWNYFGDDAEQIITELLIQNYINETRFATAYVSGKFRLKYWGKIKIKMHLKQLQVSEYNIKKGLEEIDPDEYWEVLLKWVAKKDNQIKESNAYIKRGKITQFLVGKGFEYDLINDAIKFHFT